jgi:hypothetical protein
LTRLRREGSKGSKGAEGSKGCGGRFRRQYISSKGHGFAVGCGLLSQAGCVEGLRRFAQGGGRRPSKRRGASLYKTFTTALKGDGKASPLWWLAPPPSPPQAVGQQPVLTLAPLMSGMLYGALLCPRTAGERWCRRHQRGKSHRRRLTHHNA